MNFLETLVENVTSGINRSTGAYEEQMRQRIAEFGDPLAERTDWMPLLRGGTNMSSHVLEIQPNGNLAFKMSLGMKFFTGIFMAVGIVGMSLIAMSLWGQNDASGAFASSGWTILLPGIFLAIGIFMYRSGTKPIVFDRQSGYFYKGQLPEGQNGLALPNGAESTQIGNIHAIQIIHERVSGNKSSFLSFEMNLVLESGSRINVVDHGNLNQIRQDASRIAQDIGVRVWDTSDIRPMGFFF